jgi:hypothetical protein
MTSQAGVALLRLAAFCLAAVCVGLVLAVFAAGASTADEQAGIATVQTAVFFFGPIAAIATLAFIVVLALTRPASLALRRRAARAVAVAYAILGAALAIALASTWWGLLGGAACTLTAGLAWWMLGRPEPLATPEP